MKQILILGVSIFLFFTSCDVTENIQDGQTAFALKKYALAAELLQKDFNKEQLSDPKSKLAYQIGQSYQYNNEFAEAAQWYKSAIEWEYGSDAILAYAKMLKAQEKYTDAIQQFNEYLKEEPYRKPEISTEINICEAALQWMKNQDDEYEKDTYITNVSMLNSSEADFNLVLFKSDVVLFTSSRATSTGDKKDSWTTNKYYDIFQSTLTNESFSSPEPFPGIFNTEFNDGTLSFSSDGNEVFFTRCGSSDKKIDDYCGLYYSSFEADAGWGEPVSLPFFEDSMNIGTPCLSPDGQVLYFAAVDPDGYGGSDLYASKRMFDGWDAPQNLGTSLNTSGNEVFPYFGPDGTFYFSSDGHPGIGGLDIFSANIVKGKFSKISNMKYPINSGADDFGMLILNKTFVSGDTLQFGYFSSNRKGGKGGDDIYEFVKTKKKLRPPVFVLKGRVMQKVYEDSLDVNSRVIDTIPLSNAIATIGYPKSQDIIAKFKLVEKEMFTYFIDQQKEYRVSGAKDGFFQSSVFVSAKDKAGKPGDTLELYTEVVLDKVPVKTGTGTAEIKLKNIYYDYNDTTLRPESFPELDKLVNLLKENTNLVIQINSHTDARGTLPYNEKLSRGRANSVVQYLIQNGISPERLLAKGFGESTPDVIRKEEKTANGKTIPANTVLNESFINSFKSDKTDFEYLHQLNRRTTFNIVSDTFNINSEESEKVRDDNPKQD
ncbi:MAG: OmpA family protein [Chitinophagales bacterium]